MYPWIRLAPRMDRLAAASDRIDALMRASHNKRGAAATSRATRHTKRALLYIGAFANVRILRHPGTNLPCTNSC